MDADIAALERFAEVPAIVMAASSRGALAAAAAETVVQARKKNAGKKAKVSLDTSKGIPVERYRALIKDVRAQIESDLNAKDYKIAVIDMSAPDLNKELRQANRHLAGMSKFYRAKYKEMGPFTFGVMALAKESPTCVMTGFDPEDDAGETLGFPKEGDPKRRGMSEELVHRFVLWHELGHCVLGGSEGKADVFAALMALRHTDMSVEALSMWTTAREMSEWSTPLVEDTHFMAKGLWAVVARADAMRADPRFMEMDALEIAGLAKSIWEADGLTIEEEKHVRDFRRAFAKAQNAKAHYIKTDDGLKPTLFYGWLAQNDHIPEVRRVIDLAGNLMEGAKPLAPFKGDPQAFRRNLAELAKAGDPTAKGMLRTIDSKDTSLPPQPKGRMLLSEGLGIAIPFKMEKSPFHDQVIAFDPACQTVIFSDDQARYAVLDRAESRIVNSGAILLGDVRAFAEAKEESADAELASAPAPR